MLETEPPEAGSASARFDVFLSHNGRDHAIVERIAQQLRRERIRPWLDAWCLVPGTDWQRGLADGLAGSRACAVLVGPGDLGAWANQEVALALDRAATDPEFRVFLVLLPGVPERFDVTGLSPFLRMRTWVDLRGGIERRQAFSDLVRAVKGLPLGSEPTVESDTDRCPYRGLEAFEEEHAEFFFGRDADIQRLLERLKGTRFLAVLGASGSGKSSLVRAGLVPALRADVGEGRWEIAILRPGGRPLEALASQLAQLGGGAMQQTLDHLGADPRTLHLAAALALSSRKERTRLLLLVDQSEELFTLCQVESERQAFFTNLLFAATVPDAPTTVLLTMRADFYHRCGAYPELAQQLAAQQYLVSPMQPDGLRQALEEPARRVGLAFEPGLVATILDDVARQPGALPLLEHALLELWRRRSGGLLTLAAYMESGGVHGAIAKRAEEIFASLAPADQLLARRTFLRLTQPGYGTEDTRRRAQLTELQGASEIEPVLTRLVDSRLLTTSREETAGQTIEVAHEALIRGWPRLQGWIDEDRAGLRIHRRLTAAAEEWARLDRDESALYRGAPLAEAAEWQRLDTPDLNELETAFLDASRAGERRTLARDRRRVRRLRVLLASLAVLFVAAAVTAVLAVRQTEKANRQAATSLSRGLAEQALARVDNDVDLALLLGLEAYRRDETFEARNALVTAIGKADGYTGFLRGHDQPVVAVSFASDGRTLVSVDEGGTARRWDLGGRRQLGESLATGHGGVTAAAVSPDATTVAAGADSDSLRLWDIEARRPLRVVPRSRPGVYTVAFSPDGETVAWGGPDVSTRVWDIDRERFATTRFDGNDGVAFSPDGTQLATADSGEVSLWALDRHDRVARFSVIDSVESLAFSGDGRLLAAGDNDGRIAVLDVARGRVRERMQARGGAAVLAFGADGETLAAGGEDGTLEIWNVAAGGRQVGEPLAVGDGGITSLQFSADGGTLALGGKDGTVRLRSVDRGLLAEQIGPRSLALETLTFRSDGATVATGGDDGWLRLWDVGEHRQLRGQPPVSRSRFQIAPQVAFSPDGDTLVTGHESGIRGTVRFRNARGDPLGDPVKAGADVSGMAFSPDGDSLVTGDAVLGIHLWDVARRRQRDSLPGPGGMPVWAVDISSDGKTLAAGGQGGLELWDPAGGGQLGETLGAGRGVDMLKFSPDGRLLAWDDGALRLLDVERRRPSDGALTARRVSGVTFSRDGRTLVVAADTELQFWDLKQRRRLGQPLDAGFVSAVAFSPDGKRLVSGGEGLKLWDPVLWTTDAGVLADHVCGAVRRSLTREEWEFYLPDVPHRATCG